MKPLNLILLVDDDETTNYLNQRLLTRMQVAERIDIVTNGEEAIRYLNSCDNSGSNPCPELIFVDIKMPVMDGFEFLEEYQKLDKVKRSGQVMLMLTSSASFYDLEHLKKFPDVQKHYSKPLSEADVREIMNTYFPGHFQLGDLNIQEI